MNIRFGNPTCYQHMPHILTILKWCGIFITFIKKQICQLIFVHNIFSTDLIYSLSKVICLLKYEQIRFLVLYCNRMVKTISIKFPTLLNKTRIHWYSQTVNISAILQMSLIHNKYLERGKEFTLPILTQIFKGMFIITVG